MPHPLQRVFLVIPACMALLRGLLAVSPALKDPTLSPLPLLLAHFVARGPTLLLSERPWLPLASLAPRGSMHRVLGPAPVPHARLESMFPLKVQPLVNGVLLGPIQ